MRNHERPEIPHDTEESLKHLIERCWHPSPDARPDFKQIIAALDKIFIDIVIPRGGQGRDFWHKYFLGKEEVPWSQFKDCMVLYLSLDRIPQERREVNFKCLETLLLPQGHHGEIITKQPVTLSNWGKVLHYFGPFQLPETPDGKTMLDHIAEIFKEPWFHGDTDSQNAQTLLAAKPMGTFMIRFSSIEGWYTISEVQGRTIQHQRISHESGGSFIIEGDSYPSLQELVTGRKLTQPCEGSRYNRLLDNDSINYYPMGYKPKDKDNNNNNTKPKKK